MILATLCFLLSGACFAILYCQAVMRGATVRQHLRDAFRAAAKGESPPRWRPRPACPVDHERIAELEQEMGMEPRP